jgi:hypothetical protein
MHDARYMYAQNALPQFLDYVNDRAGREIGDGRQLKKVVSIADALLNISDYLYDDLETRPLMTGFATANAYRKFLRGADDRYRLACDIANAAKHRSIDKNDPLLSSIHQVVETAQHCRFRDADGEYYRGVRGVYAVLDDGRSLDSRPLLTGAIITISRELVRLKVIPDYPTEALTVSEFIHRSDAAFLEPLVILGRVGEPVHLKMLMRDFDPASGILVEAGPNFNSRLKFKSVIRQSLFPVGGATTNE